MTDVDSFEEDEFEDRERQLRLGRDRRQNGINKLLQDKEVREWLWDMLLQCGVFTQLPGLDPIQMAYRSGRKDIGMLILNEIILANPDAYRKMMEEN